MASPAHLHLRNQICLSLYSATNALTRAYRPLLAPLGLTYAQYLVMLALWEDDELSVTEICARTRLDSGTVTPLLKRLEGKGLVERGRSADDERKRVISLTKAGAALQKAADGVPKAMACLDLLAPRQAQTLKELAEALYRRLESRADEDEP